MIFQSTLPREERLTSSDAINIVTNISIHAPTRGATKCGRGNRKSCKISIHAPTRGATLHVAFCYNYITFQSTLPREERQLIIVRFKMRKVFQSTLPREERLTRFCFVIFFIKFQSTLPREERHGTSRINAYQILISIHAPTRGATVSGSSPFGFRVFQSTLPREERLPAIGINYHVEDFNPRSHERSDRIAEYPVLERLHFNPRSHERSDSSLSKSICYTLKISIHAPTRGATILGQ